MKHGATKWILQRINLTLWARNPSVKKQPLYFTPVAPRGQKIVSDKHSRTVNIKRSLLAVLWVSVNDSHDSPRRLLRGTLARFSIPVVTRSGERRLCVLKVPTDFYVLLSSFLTNIRNKSNCFGWRKIGYWQPDCLVLYHNSCFPISMKYHKMNSLCFNLTWL